MARRRPSAFVRHTPSHRVLSLAVHAAVLAMGFASTGASAQPAASATAAPEAQKVYRIAAGPLDEALGGFAAAAGVSITVPPALVQGKSTRGLDGGFTVRDGFARLLAGSGLEVTGGTGGAFALRRAVAGDTEASGTTLASVTVTAQAERAATTAGTRSYATRATTIGKTEQAIKDIPQSVSVVTRQRMDDQNLLSLSDVVNNTTGLVATQGMGAGIAVTARGFLLDTMQYDGVAVPRNTYSLGNWGSESLVFYDRVEVLRGAAGLLQGAGSPGGAINFVRKRGQAERTVSLTGKAGSWDRYGVQLDAGGPLNAEGTLRGRLVLDEDRGHSFIDSVWNRTRSSYAALDYDIDADTTVGLGVSNKHSRSRPTFIGLPRYRDTRDIGLPRSTFTGANWNRAYNDQTSVYADLEHRFNDRWVFKASALGMNETNSSVHQRIAGVVNADGSGPNYGDFATDLRGQQRGLDVYLRGRFEALAMPHEVVIGANYSKYTTDDAYARAWTPGVNVFDIDHDRPQQDYASIAARGSSTRSSYDVRQKGLYGTWRAGLTDSLTAVVGARASWYDSVYAQPLDDYRSPSSASGKVTPYVGLVQALNKQWSAYASYTDVFEPQTARTAAGEVLKPVLGSNYELGLKGELMDGRVNASFAVFRYDHKNRAVTDFASGFACDGWYCSNASGKVRSQGFEAELSGEVLRGLQLAAGYTFNTTRYLEDAQYKGQVFSTWTPKHLVRVWADYRLPGAWSRLSIGGGVNLQSRALSFDRAFQVPGFAVWGARIAYQATPTVSVAVNLNNVFDKRYYIPSYNGTDGSNYYGDPRNVMFTLKYTPKL
ncbi:TonB-dependent siderophore receptor [Variovorax boronicumulans]|uniref:TonB-dependent siderophore receptor n=1 Tax=Variovorax boronicumulans TaxID=436515 RepID=UPI001C5893A5